MVALAAVLYVATPWEAVSFLAVAPFGLAFGIGYPALLDSFAASMGPAEQGWVMGFGMALFTLGAGIVSLAGGSLTVLSPAAPFVLCLVSALTAVALVGLFWRRGTVGCGASRPAREGKLSRTDRSGSATSGISPSRRS